MSASTTFAFTSETTADDVRTAYAAADIGEKSAMRTARVAAMTAAVLSGDTDSAVLFAGFETIMVAAKSEKAPVDYAAVAADRVADLYATIDIIMSGDFSVPDGHAAPSAADVMRALSARGGIDGGTPITGGTRLSGRKAGRGSVADYVASVTTEKAQTIAQLRNAWSASDDYPTEPPSAGAIGACLVRDDDDRFDAVDVNGKRGAKLS